MIYAGRRQSKGVMPWPPKLTNDDDEVMLITPPRRMTPELSGRASDDDAWFAAHPERRYRIRNSNAAEIMMQIAATLPDQCCWMTCVRWNGVAMRRLVFAYWAEAEVDDIAEEIARLMFEGLEKRVLLRV